MLLHTDAESLWGLCEAVRSSNPLIQCITNFVSMVSPVYTYMLACVLCVPQAVVPSGTFGFVFKIFSVVRQDIMANTLLAIGASPAMVGIRNDACLAAYQQLFAC